MESVPIDNLKEICEGMDYETLGSYIQTSRRVYDNCRSILIKRKEELIDELYNILINQPSYYGAPQPPFSFIKDTDLLTIEMNIRKNHYNPNEYMLNQQISNIPGLKWPSSSEYENSSGIIRSAKRFFGQNQLKLHIREILDDGYHPSKELKERLRIQRFIQSSNSI